MKEKISNLEKSLLLGKNYAHGKSPQTMTGERYILCDCALSNYGKSNVLTAVADYYISNPTLYTILTSKIFKDDRWLVVREISTNKIILVQTKGDDAGCFSRTISYLYNSKNPIVDIILCASHPNDVTHNIVKAIAGKTFKLFCFTNFYPDQKYKKWILPASNIVKVQLKNTIIDIINQL